jgi:hypothetical protein
MADETLTRQVGGSHYTMMPIQPWEIIDLLDLGFYEGCALKYILRKKSGANRVEELKKAIHCLEHLIYLEMPHDPNRKQ